MAGCEPANELSPNTKSISSLILDFPSFSTMRNKCLLSRPKKKKNVFLTACDFSLLLNFNSSKNESQLSFGPFFSQTAVSWLCHEIEGSKGFIHKVEVLMTRRSGYLQPGMHTSTLLHILFYLLLTDFTFKLSPILFTLMDLWKNSNW